MKKTLWFIVISVIAIIFGFLVGRAFFKQKISNLYSIENTSTNIEIKETIKSKNEEIETSVPQEKISINTNIIEEIFYKECNHKIEYHLKNKDKYVNMTKERMQKEFPSWEIIEFSNDKVVLHKEENNFCNEHFKVIDEDGFVTIYSIDNNENILNFIDKTEIVTKYLTSQDQEHLKSGIIIYGMQNLNKLIEDYE